jgi:hypothetical protein
MFNVSVFFDLENSHSRKLFVVLITRSGSAKALISERMGVGVELFLRDIKL